MRLARESSHRVTRYASANLIHRLGYRLTGSVSYLNAMKGLLEKLEPEMRDSSFTGNINLCKLLSGGNLSDDQCEDAFMEIEVSAD